MSSASQSLEAPSINAGPISSTLVADLLTDAPKDGKDIVSDSRDEAKAILSDGGVPPIDPSKPESPKSRDRLTEALHLESQYEARGDALVELKARDFFAEGVPLPTYKQVLNTFTTDQLGIALGYQDPRLLLVPATSFKAKMKALDVAMAIARRRISLSIQHLGGDSKEGREMAEWALKWGRSVFATEVVEKLSNKVDHGSDRVTGWRAVIMDGADEINAEAMGDDTNGCFDERIFHLRKNRRPGESGMDLHLYSMWVLEKLMRGEMISKWFVTLCDNDMEAFKPYIPQIVSFHEQDVMVAISLAVHRAPRWVRFRRSIGGIVKT